jgi:MFS superfamily sulfate permease-like transporter
MIPGLIIYRFEAPLVFFNVDYFTDRVRTLIHHAESKPTRFLFNAESVPVLDVSGAYALEALHAELAEQGIVFCIARPRGLFWLMLERAGVHEKIGKENLFHTVHAGAASFRRNGEGIDASQDH